MIEQPGDLLGQSPAIRTLREKLARVRDRQQSGRRLPAILLRGETGTGKGLVARLIHRQGSRRGAPFVDVNCAAIPDTLLEAELFGFERGAFTDARHPKPGLFQAAHHGTLFLDEVGLLPEPLQAKLLTAIEERVVRRLGSIRSEPAEVDLISATNSDLQAAVRARRFREDLYHRLAVITLDLPPLRDRGEDILLLAEHFLARTCAEHGLPPKRLDAQAQARLVAYSWPGNVRELANTIERTTLFADGPTITGAMLDLLEVDAAPEVAETDAEATPIGTLADATRQQLVAALTRTGWNISRTADLLGVSRNTVYAQIEKFGLRPPARPSAARGRSHPPESTFAAVPPAPGPRLHWERRHLTLLRAVLNASAETEDLSSEGRALDEVLDKVQAFGGRVEELSPTGVVAAFGVDPVEDAPRRAAHAALAIHKVAARTRGSSAAVPGVKIALHVAELMIAHAGSRIEIDADARRAQWSILERLVERMAPEETAVSSAIMPSLERRFELVPVRGDDGSVHSYRLTGQERRGLGLWGEMTEFVGRDDEMEILRGRLASARDGQGQLVTIAGEPGIGKSRLIWEFTRSNHVQGCQVLESGAVSYGQGTAYLAVIALLKSYCRIGERDDERTAREKLIGRLLALDPGLRAALPAFLALLDLPVDDRKWQALEPAQRRRRTLAALSRLFLRECQVQPLILVFEDLHWVDRETQAVLDVLVENLPGSRLLLLATYRPSYTHPWAGTASLTELALPPLRGASSRAFLERLIGRDPSLEPFAQLLVDRSEGSPLFLEESVREAVEAGALVGERGGYRLAREVTAIQIPASVQAILAVRVDRLPPQAKRLLQSAAVIGVDVPAPVLTEIAQLDEATLAQTLGHLQSAELLYRVVVMDEAQYSFRHALTHEVAYVSLSEGARQSLHARIVEAVEKLYPTRLTEHVERLAHHAFMGRLWEKAVTYARLAGQKAALHSANQEAVARFEGALASLGHLPDTRETREQAVDLRLDLRNSLVFLGRSTSLLQYLREAEEFARMLGDRRRLGLASAYLCHYFWLSGEASQACAWGRAAQATAEEIADPELAFVASTYLAFALYTAGAYREAADSLAGLVRASEGVVISGRHVHATVTSVVSRAMLVLSRAELGEFDDGVLEAEEAIRLAERADHWPNLRMGRYSMSYLHATLAHLHGLRGEFDKAATLIEEAAGARVADRPYDPIVLGVLGHLSLGSRRFEEAIPLLRNAVAAAERGQLGPFEWRVRVHLGEAYVQVGRLPEARELAERTLALTRERGQRGGEAWARRLLGRIAARGDGSDPESAAAHLRSALDRATELGMRPLAAHCRLDLGSVYRSVGSLSQAAEHFTAATKMYREMDMEFWLTRKDALYSS